MTPHLAEQVIKTERWLDPIEMHSLLKEVSHILLASPTDTPNTIEFTAFLNTSDPIPESIIPEIIAKLSKENRIKDTHLLFSGLKEVAFAKTGHETPLPILTDTLDETATPIAQSMFLIVFTGHSNGFENLKEGLSGWSYVKN